jgi:hypothetical protein
MSEVSRLGREQIETAYALKQLSTAGVRCFSYLAGLADADRHAREARAAQEGQKR